MIDHLTNISESKTSAGNNNHKVICPKNALDNRTFHLQCRAEGSDSKVMNVISEPSIYDNEASSLPQFRSFFLAMAFSWVGMAVVVSVGDAICFDQLGEKHHLYGQQRLWGAVGWGVFSIIAGWLVDENSLHQNYKNYSVVFYLMLAAIFPDVLVSTCLNVSKLILDLWDVIDCLIISILSPSIIHIKYHQILLEILLNSFIR